MKALPLFILLLSASVGSGCAIEAHGDFIHVEGTTVNSSAKEVEALVERGEELHTAIAALHPPDMTLDPEVRVVLHGRYDDTAPYVDEEGTVHLWRFSEGEGGYFAMYAHELVHAIAYDHIDAMGGFDQEEAFFYLEGWAEYAALLVDPGKTGFPLFGFAEDVVVGHWLEHGGIDLATLRERHHELSLRCQGQSYILRASWFRYVDEEIGEDALLDLVAARDGMSPATVEAILGAPLDEVDADWTAWAEARYDAHEGAAEQAQDYRASMDRWYTPCVE